MLVNVSHVTQNPGKSVDFSTDVLLTDSVHPQNDEDTAARVQGSLTADRGGKLSLAGDIAAQVPLCCARCGQGFKASVNTPVEAVFAVSPEPAGIRLDNDEYAYSANQISLIPMTAEWITLALPLAPTCPACQAIE